MKLNSLCIVLIFTGLLSLNKPCVAKIDQSNANLAPVTSLSPLPVQLSNRLHVGDWAAYKLDGFTDDKFYILSVDPVDSQTVKISKSYISKPWFNTNREYIYTSQECSIIDINSKTTLSSYYVVNEIIDSKYILIDSKIIRINGQVFNCNRITYDSTSIGDSYNEEMEISDKVNVFGMVHYEWHRYWPVAESSFTKQMETFSVTLVGYGSGNHITWGINPYTSELNIVK